MAVLIQAKQSDTGSTSLTTHSERKQFDLLTGRPIFDVDATPAPSGVDLTSYSPDNALMYGLTPPDATPPKPSAWSSHRWYTADCLGSLVAKYRVSAGICLADILVKQLEGKRGWNFRLPPTTKDWRYFASAAAPNHWSALINYLLQVTFSKPLTQLKNPTGGHPNRGLDIPLYLRSRTPTGKIAFAVVDYDAEGAGGETFDWIASPRSGSSDQGEWHPTDAIPWSTLGGDNASGGGGGLETEPTPSPGSGPISAIVFEIDRRREK